MYVEEEALVLVTETDSVLGLVEDGASRRAVDLTVLAAADLVREFLTGGLGIVGLNTTVIY